MPYTVFEETKRVVSHFYAVYISLHGWAIYNQSQHPLSSSPFTRES